MEKHRKWTAALIFAACSLCPAAFGENTAKPLKAGIIGLDTSHVIAFTKLLNDPKAPPELAGCPVVAAYPKGSTDIESSTSRVPGYTAQMKELGVEIVDSIEALLAKVDVVLLESNDGRVHLEQIRPAIKAGKPVFIDKPMTASLRDAILIFDEASQAGVPVFSSSSLRFSKNTSEVRAGKLGLVTYCETHSPCSREKSHPDLFWYGIHGVESLFTVMGTGCETVKRRTTSEGAIEVEGTWAGGRTGIYREAKDYGGLARGEKGEAAVGNYESYRPLVIEIVKFFRTGVPPVPAAETLELLAFMEAADESKRLNGEAVSIRSVMDKARAAAAQR